MKTHDVEEFEPVFFSGEIWNPEGMNTFILLKARHNIQFLEAMPAHWALKFGSKTWKPAVRNAYRPWNLEPETWWDRQFGKFLDWFTDLFSRRKVKAEADEEDMHYGFKGWSEKHVGISQVHWKFHIDDGQSKNIKTNLLSAI